MYVDDSKRSGSDLFCDYLYLVEDINIGDVIMVDSGLCRVKVLEKIEDHINIQVLNDCTIGYRRHINLSGVKLKMPGINDKDKIDVLFSIENDYNFIAMSFIRNKENIVELRDLLEEKTVSLFTSQDHGKHGNQKRNLMKQVIELGESIGVKHDVSTVNIDS